MHSLTMRYPVSLPYINYALLYAAQCARWTPAKADGHRDAAVERFDKLDFEARSSLSYRSYRLVLTSSVQGNTIQRTKTENQRLRKSSA